MIVKLIGYTTPMDLTKSPTQFVGACAKGCYSEKPSYEIIDELTEESAAKTLEHIVASGHGSVLEHLVFTFSVEGISRACSHQLVRHRMASFSQQSQRYVKFDNLDMVIPHSVKNVEEEELNDTHTPGKCVSLVSEFIDEYQEWLFNFVGYLRSKGVPEEDIRYFYPNAATTDITITMNARSLLNFFKWRCCEQAQWEIRELANSMLSICKVVAPVIFKNAGPECRRTGCQEGKRSCKRNVKVEE